MSPLARPCPGGSPVGPIRSNTTLILPRMQPASRHALPCMHHTGYEVQTVRLATQPFSAFLGTPSPALIPAAARLEQLAKSHGIPLLSIGASNRPEDLEYIPGIIAATSSTSCSYTLPSDAPLQLVQAAAAAVLEVARRTGVCGHVVGVHAAATAAGHPAPALSHGQHAHMHAWSMHTCTTPTSSTRRHLWVEVERKFCCTRAPVTGWSDGGYS
jgi:hypothetical protein